MAYVTIIAMLALIEFSIFGLKVGQARGQFGVEAPATSGHETFDRVFRVQQNTLEQLISFLPALYAFAYFVSEVWAVGLGVVYLIGRAIYFRAYVAEPGGRTIGFMATFLPIQVMIFGAIIGALMDVL